MGETSVKTISKEGQFKSVMSIASDDLDVDFGKLLREGGLRMFRDLVIYTPKDTGWASQHWSVGLNRTTESIAVTTDSLTKAVLGDTVHVFNNVEYIKRLDDGWSSQRPSGFSNIVNMRIKRWLREQANSLSVKVYKDV